ncbi:MAG: hypothetical protein ACR2F1_15320 [Nitrososphaeraceae archaeon]
MSCQEEKKEITDLRQKEQEKTNLSSLEIHIHDYENVISSSTIFPQNKNKVPPRNFDNLINYNLTIKTLKDIKYNFIEEHKNIINTYYSIYSQRFDDIIYYNLDNLMALENHVDNNINQNLIDNQTNTTKIINEIVDKNMDTFIKSITFARKFYSDVTQSYCNYLRMIISGSIKS